ncbi:MAG: hypothetical protein WC602_02580 [archaeon]
MKHDLHAMLFCLAVLVLVGSASAQSENFIPGVERTLFHGCDGNSQFNLPAINSDWSWSGNDVKYKISPDDHADAKKSNLSAEVLMGNDESPCATKLCDATQFTTNLFQRLDLIESYYKANGVFSQIYGIHTAISDQKNIGMQPIAENQKVNTTIAIKDGDWQEFTLQKNGEIQGIRLWAGKNGVKYHIELWGGEPVFADGNEILWKSESADSNSDAEEITFYSKDLNTGNWAGHRLVFRIEKSGSNPEEIVSQAQTGSEALNRFSGKGDASIRFEVLGNVDATDYLLKNYYVWLMDDGYSARSFLNDYEKIANESFFDAPSSFKEKTELSRLLEIDGNGNRKLDMDWNDFNGLGLYLVKIETEYAGNWIYSAKASPKKVLGLENGGVIPYLPLDPNSSGSAIERNGYGTGALGKTIIYATAGADILLKIPTGKDSLHKVSVNAGSEINGINIEKKMNDFDVNISPQMQSIPYAEFISRPQEYCVEEATQNRLTIKEMELPQACPLKPPSRFPRPVFFKSSDERVWNNYDPAIEKMLIGLWDNYNAAIVIYTANNIPDGNGEKNYAQSKFLELGLGGRGNENNHLILVNLRNGAVVWANGSAFEKIGAVPAALEGGRVNKGKLREIIEKKLGAFRLALSGICKPFDFKAAKGEKYQLIIMPMDWNGADDIETEFKKIVPALERMVPFSVSVEVLDQKKYNCQIDAKAVNKLGKYDAFLNLRNCVMKFGIKSPNVKNRVVLVGYGNMPVKFKGMSSSDKSFGAIIIVRSSEVDAVAQLQDSLNQKMIFERSIPNTFAHELGHKIFNYCEEYNYSLYSLEKGGFFGPEVKSCANPYPACCTDSPIYEGQYGADTLKYGVNCVPSELTAGKKTFYCAGNPCQPSTGYNYCRSVMGSGSIFESPLLEPKLLIYDKNGSK